eukprot:scaffold39516_cov35-Attheya_sp.AAC.2
MATLSPTQQVGMYTMAASSLSHLVWQRIGTVWHTYRAKNGRCSAQLSQRHFTKQTSQPNELFTAPTCDATPTIVYSTRNKAIIVCTGIHVATSHPQIPVNTPSAIPRRTLAELLAGGRRNRRWATRNIGIHDNGKNVAQSIREGTARAVSDGSYINGSGAAGYVLLGTSHRSRITGSLVLPGSSLVMSAYRSELGGLYGIICVVEDVCTIHTIESGHITIGCDGKEARWQSLGSTSPISPQASDFDLVAAI